VLRGIIIWIDGGSRLKKLYKTLP